MLESASPEGQTYSGPKQLFWFGIQEGVPWRWSGDRWINGISAELFKFPTSFFPVD